MATAGSFTKYRSWSTIESEDPNDVGRLYIPESPASKKSKGTYSTWAFSLVILSLSVMFLIGLLVGYFLKDSQKEECSFGKRRDKIESHLLHSVHENIMYFISNDNVRKISRELSLLKSNRQTEYVRKEFQSYGLDRIEVQEYDVVVTYPDPRKPHRLVVYNAESNQVLANLTLEEEKITKKVKNVIKSNADNGVDRKNSFVEGKLVYVDYGRPLDFEKKNRINSLKGKVLLVKDGQISIEEKIRLGFSYGVIGILLQQSNDDDVFLKQSDCADVPEKYSVPVLPVTNTVAEQLIALYSKHRNVSVQMSLHHVVVRQKVKNIVGTITGDLERDRFVMVGASKSSTIGTSYMLELARSLKDMQRLNGWTPRRSIKFYSWDHDGVTNLGFRQYSLNQNLFTESSIAGYIDLDLIHHGNSSHWLQLSGNVMFSKTVHNIVKEVPDPHDPNLVLDDTWDGVLLPVSTGTQYQQLGVPVFSSVVSNTHNFTEKSDENHHHMYSLAAARVASLVTLRLLDEELLPYSITNYTSQIYDAVVNTVLYINRNFKDRVKTDKLLSKAAEFLSAGNTFTDYIPQLLKSDDVLAVRRVNDAIMRFQRIVSLLKRGDKSKETILYPKTQFTSSISHTLSIATVTNDNSQSQCWIDSLEQILQEAISSLHYI